MKNDLKLLNQFEQILGSYKVSDQASSILKSVKLVLLTSPTAVGRNTIIKSLTKTGRYYFIVSDTTRQPRINDGVMEQSGVEYWFLSEEQFLEGLKKGQYLEAGIIHNQQVSGISLRVLDQARKENKIAITDIEVRGVNTIISAKADTHAIFLLPPSFDEWMKRLDGRGMMADSEKARRLNTAVEEYEFALSADYLTYLICSTVEQSVSDLNSIVEGSYKDDKESAKALIKQLILDTKQKLNKLS